MILKIFSTLIVSVSLMMTFSLWALECPEGYIAIKGDAQFKTRDFCVMKFEAQRSEDGQAVSLSEGVPWIEIDAHAAKKACRDLGEGFDLISNNQWMTIARQIELNAANWSSKIIGVGMMNRGNTEHHDSLLPLGAFADDADVFSGTLGVASRVPCPRRYVCQPGWEQKRTHVIGNEVEIANFIADFSGNVWEWVDWREGDESQDNYQTPAPLENQTNGCMYDRTSLYNPYCSYLVPAMIAPAHPNLRHDQGVGVFYGDYLGGSGVNGVGYIEAQARGGDFSSSENAGIYAFMFISNSESRYIGFRCVKVRHPFADAK